MSRTWETIIRSATDAITKTLNNRFDVIKTAKELNDKYSDKSTFKK